MVNRTFRLEKSKHPKDLYGIEIMHDYYSVTESLKSREAGISHSCKVALE